MPRLILAAINPDNTPHGYNWTFAFPMLLFIVIAVLLYLLFSRPHRRVPSRPVSVPAAGHVPVQDVARSAAVAGGLSTAPGGGTTESHLEPSGAYLAAGGHVEPVETDELDRGAPAGDDTAAGDDSAVHDDTAAGDDSAVHDDTAAGDDQAETSGSEAGA